MQKLIQKLALSIDLTPAEQAFLEDLPERSGSVQSRTELITSGEPITEVVVLQHGWAIRHRSLSDGRRQILNFSLPGDLTGMEGNLLHAADYSLTTLTRSEVAWFPVARVIDLFERFPRVAAALSWASFREQSIFLERLVSLGRRSARERLAHLLCELWVRLTATGHGEGPSFAMPVTQEELADTLGLSAVHIYRTLRSLRQAGLVRIEGQRVYIDRPDELMLEAEFEHGYMHHREMPAPTKDRIQAPKS
jgi:CRP-like cAMP-binding protein